MLRTGDICHKDENGWLYFDFREGGGQSKCCRFVNKNPWVIGKRVCSFVLYKILVI